MHTDNTNTASSPAIELNDLQFSWSSGGGPLLDIPRLSLARGERVFLYGPSGSGKTSLLNLLAGVSLPQQGQVHLLGHDLSALSARQRDRFRARHIGVVFQQFNLIPYLSVQDNIELAAHFARLETKTPELHRRTRELLDALGLSAELAGRPASQLSVGQQQRVAVARALITRPEILLADEPSSALDTDTRDAFMQLLLAQAEASNCTLVFVSHDRSLAEHFDRQLHMRELTPSPVAGEVA